MSMLAGPRRKQKVINLRAKNNAWSNDNSKFGQRMLERMGWSEGKGLGLKENGIVEHVVAKYKNDDKGLGFEDRNDQWTKHEDDFNSLLANLSNDDVKEDKLHSGISLEDKSKKSKARVHYHKFTRGKDLTQYSEKDLANIFGKKSLKTEEKIGKPVKDDLKSTTEQKFTEKGSMEDYFKNKLAAIKSKSKIQISDYIENETDYVFRGFSGTKTDTDKSETHQSFAFDPFSLLKNATDHDNPQKLESTMDDEKSKTKKKYKKNKCNKETESLEQIDFISSSDSLNIEFNNDKDCDKKKKRKKGMYQELAIMENNHTENNLLNSTYSNLSESSSNIEETKTKKAKKSKRKKDMETEDSQNIEFTENDNMKNNCSLSGTHGKKKKKIKNMKYEQLPEECQEATNNNSETHDHCHIPKKKKKKKK